MSQRGKFYLMVLLAVVVIIAALHMICVYDSEVVQLKLKIDGCTCSMYSEFELHWDEASSLLIDELALTNLLIWADSCGSLLCDCSHGDGDAYVSMVKSVEPLESGLGLKIVLSQEVYLTWPDIANNLIVVLEANKAEVFRGHDFKIGY